MRRPTEPLLERDPENEQVLEDLNEMMMRIKYHIHVGLDGKSPDLDRRFPPIPIRELDVLMVRIRSAMRKHDRPAIKY